MINETDQEIEELRKKLIAACEHLENGGLEVARKKVRRNTDRAKKELEGASTED